MPEPLVLLASSSPRRRLLLGRLGLPFEVVSPEVDETPRPNENPTAYVRRIAAEKAVAVPAPIGLPVLAADTAVVVDEHILGKPESATEALAMLERIAGRAHTVLTGVAIARSGEVVEEAVVTTTVWMTDIPEQAARWYVATGEPLDKAGAYAIQERGGLFVERVDGCVSNVVGLPLAETASLLQNVGLDPWAPATD